MTVSLDHTCLHLFLGCCLASHWEFPEKEKKRHKPYQNPAAADQYNLMVTLRSEFSKHLKASATFVGLE